MKKQIKMPGFRSLLLLCACVTVILAMAPAVGTSARAEDVFTVQGVRMDITAASASEARAQALKAGQQEALARLLRRLTPSDAWDRLPEVAPDTIPSLVQGLQINGEKTSQTRYLGWLGVSFKPWAISELLRDADIEFSQIQAGPTLLLPVYRDKDGSLLWQEHNPWRHAWLRADVVGSLTPFILPVGDLQDIADVTVQQVLTGDKQALYNLTARYQLDRVMVAQALSPPGGGLIQVVATLHSNEGPRQTSTFIVFDGEEEELSPTPGADGTASASAPRESLLDRSVQQVIARSEAVWKETLFARDDTGGSLLVRVSYDTLGQWIAIRKRLQDVALIEDFTVEDQTISGVRLSLTHLGDVDSLMTALLRRNLELIREEGGWVVRGLL